MTSTIRKGDFYTLSATTTFIYLCIYFIYSIGNARFMKTILGRHERDGYVVVKIFVKPELGMSLKKRVKKLKEEYKTLSDVHNAFSFQRILETDRAAYLVRQYLYSNLYDRISTRPFLTTIEKKWIAYQLIRGVADFHSRKVYHGDIKTENVLVTSWNWAFIVDFASFKPTYLPEVHT
ncbi:kinase-like protein [Rhizopus microsporus]|uniref:Kinase-like protein n=1 Tax=Rhizopus microsporus TaxID=58291 RepID=A0A1X0RSA1_RHIZD|nr:kinase-like protein [Rhizopus microsporus]